MLPTTYRRAGRPGVKTGLLRRPARRLQPPHSRNFARQSQLLLVSRPIIRPQLPYLYSNSRHALPLKQQMARLLTTETKKTIKETVIGALRLTVYWWTAVALASIAWMGWKHEQQERITPTPPEWSFWTRWHFREAKEKQFPHQLQGYAAPNWPHVASNMRSVVERLENPVIDGADIRSALGEGEGAILVEGIGKTGADISAKSEPWRRGYFQALMTAGLAAEHVEGYVKDTSRDDRVFPPDLVIGPSNPRPRPMPLTKQGIEEAPREENCEPFFELPQVYYMKVLTTTGFNNDQRMQAALAYADWLSYKNLSSSAREMYDWAIDIASESYQPPQLVPFDRNAGALRPVDTPVTSNLLTAATSMAVHFARSGDLNAALPAFFSILRVQRTLPQPPPHSTATQSEGPDSTSQWGILSKIIKDEPYPPPPPSGDEPAVRGPDSACNEAGSLAHIGEILYVTPSNNLPHSLLSQSRSNGTDAVEATPAQEAGLAWARQAVDLAEEALEVLCGRDRHQTTAPGVKANKFRAQDLGLTDTEHQKVKEACAGCLEMAMDNWQEMIGTLAMREQDIMFARKKKAASAAQAAEQPASVERVGSWFSFWKKEESADAAGNKAVGKWVDEVNNVLHQRRAEIRQLLREERLPIRKL